MSKVTEKPTIKTNSNLSDLKPFGKKTEEKIPKKIAEEKAEISNAAKNLNQVKEEGLKTNEALNATDASEKATEVAKKLATVPLLPLGTPKITSKAIDTQATKMHYIKKPAVIFIEGFSAFGISNGDGIREMSEQIENSKLFSWDQKNLIMKEIHKHAPDQPLILVGHSFGGDTAVEIANELNQLKNQFRNIDLLVSVDSVGFNNKIIPINVKRNLNFFQEGIIPLLHGDPNAPRNTEHTEVINELRNELHSRVEDSPEVQFKIFDLIKKTLNPKEETETILEIHIQAPSDIVENSLLEDEVDSPYKSN